MNSHDSFSRISGFDEAGNVRATFYDDVFYDGIEPGVIRSARAIIPIVMDSIKPTSVLDVGCGTGAWLREFLNNGVEQVMGIDGDYVDRDRLRFPAENFMPLDLKQLQLQVGEFDLAICMEVAEHLPASCAASLVSFLVGASDLVLFSAAMPGQGGTHHVNEQWPAYWQTQFAAHGYTPINLIGPKIHNNREIEWWYRQNLLLFVSSSNRNCHPEWDALRHQSDPDPLEWVHINIAAREDSVWTAIKRLNRAVSKAILRRWSRLTKALEPR